MIKAVFYDLDGVLTDTCQLHYIALNKALEALYQYSIPYEEHLITYNGLPTKVKLKLLVENGKLPQSAQDEISSINTLKQKFTMDEVEKLTYDPIKQHTLITSNSLGCVNICVTNSTNSVAEAILQKTGLLSNIACLIGNQSIEKVKPSPDCFIKAKEQVEYILGTPIEWNEVLIFEDSPLGLEAACNTDPSTNIISVKNINDLTAESVSNVITFLNNGGKV
jgi:beta-phosphoglucomutase